MYEFDLKDKRLLYELDCNSMQTIQQLAKKIGLSKDAIKYRINKLINEGIIKSFNAVIDTGKLGFLSFRLLLKFYHLSPALEKEILAFLLKNKNLVWLVRVEGNWDVNTWFLYKSVEEMSLFWQELLRRYNNYIDKKEIGIYSNVTYFGRAYLLKNKYNSFSMPIVSLPKEIKLDKSKLMIVELLSKNARMSVVNIAKATGITPKTIINKIKEIEIQIENEDNLRDLVEDLREKFSDIIKYYETLYYFKEYRLRFFPSL